MLVRKAVLLKLIPSGTVATSAIARREISAAIRFCEAVSGAASQSWVNASALSLDHQPNQPALPWPRTRAEVAGEA